MVSGSSFANIVIPAAGVYIVFFNFQIAASSPGSVYLNLETTTGHYFGPGVILSGYCSIVGTQYYTVSGQKNFFSNFTGTATCTITGPNPSYLYAIRVG